ncbi:receptor-type tyrosine-protein phosphatase C isoform X2 [Toxotes jaculatrix]|uniref:receptor-type tyrosine-protein phosphatase C isoform X2 n=1 Tax=Toxotes jaculatrix TaxID=941984 RepID=UPI001B3A9B34|nr:receptor-type tyrosine-protein phosphatase C isoform X2 [Toxotes jaculatrix]
MAGLCGLKILLLWAGIIGLGKCQSTAATTTAMMSGTSTTVHKPPLSSPTPTSVSSDQTYNSTTMSATIPTTSPIPSNQTDSQNLTSPPVTQLITTVTTTTQAPPQCSYTVTPIQFGFQFNITSSTTGNYTINIKEEGQSKTAESVTVYSNQTSSHDIKDLKPCTEYEHNVTFLDAAGKENPCNHTESKTRTIKMSKNDIEDEANCISGHVCYRSNWDISSLQSTPMKIPAEQCGNKVFCFKPGINDICSDFTTTIPSDNCRNSSFSLTKHIPVGFLNTSEINQTVSKQFPAKIEPTLPPNCKNLAIDYTCREHGVNGSKNLSELEPFTNYSCTGQIKDNNVPIGNTAAVDFRIDCDFTISFTKKSPTNTSIQLEWDTTSHNCQNVSQNLSYDCSCRPSDQKHMTAAEKHATGGTCHITGLKPYTNYTCEVQPKYNNKKVGKKASVTRGTESGIPERVSNLKETLPENNVIRVTCHSKFFHGPHKIYRARLLYGRDTLILRENTKCEFEFKDLSYLTSYTVKVTAFNGKNESQPETRDVATLYNDKALIGFLIFLIVVTSVALLVVIFKIYILKRRKSHDMSENLSLLPTGNDEENLLPVEPIVAEVLLETYKRKLADEGRLFLAEFQSIPRIFSRYTVKEAKKPCNVPKNRYVDILPYDYNRVQLATGNDEAGCDYINASFIDGYKEAKKYIAAQGPKDETVGDFWRMVWEQQSSIIVMVTRCEEGNRVKCAQYWPSPKRETEIFEEFIVKLNSEDYCPDYIIRHLSLTNKREKNSEREVTHIQFMSWPDHGVPGEPHLLLKLRRRVNAFKNFFSGPIVVHCSAGVGRTGTYIGIDAMMEGLEAEGRVDIYGYVVRLRRQRCLMVQVEAQYILIHQALLEHNQFGETEINLSEFHSTLSTLRQKNSGSEPSLVEEEFERLPAYKNWRTFNTGITEENKKKNRSSSVIPYDYNRVLLKLDEGRSHESEPDEDEEEESSDEEDEESTKYINASHIDGYWSPRAFIAAQTPLPDTMADFWLMVFQKKVSAIVMLSDSSEGDKESDSVYWDKDKKVFGDFEVEVASTDTTPTFISRNMLIRHVKRKDSRSVKQFQFLKWVNRELPENPQDLVDMVKEIKNSCGSSKSQTIVVHCNDGSSRTGIFSALWNLLDSAKTEKLVDVFQVVKSLRKERQGMVSSLEQYQFLYSALEGAFPVQNGEVKAVQASAADSVQIVNETKAAEQPAEGKAEQPASTTSDQQGTAESAPVEADGGKEDKKEPEKESSTPTETPPQEDTSNGPTVTVEV